MKKLVFLLFFVILCTSTSAQTILQPADMQYDLAVLKSTWEHTHGGLYRYITKKELNAHFEKLQSQIQKPLSLREYFVKISQLNARIHCGHTFVSYYNNKKVLKEELYSKYFLPMMFRMIDKQCILTHNLSSDTLLKPGTQIVAINDIPIPRIIDSLLTVSKADGVNGLNKQIDNMNIYKRDISTRHYCLFDIFFPLFFKKNINEQEYKLSLMMQGKKRDITVKGILKEEREKAYIQHYGPVPKNEESWWIKELNAHTVLFRLGDFATYNWKFDFKKYLDSIFTHINKKGYKNLIIDIRENEGGADQARDAVLSYLTPNSIGCANPVRRLYRYISIPDSLKPNLDTWDDEFKKDKQNYHAVEDGYFEKINDKPDCDTIYPSANRFTGKLFVITDATNSSATFIMAQCIKKNKLGKLVGEITGGTQQGINGGEIFFFYMPKSKVEMDIPLIWQKPFVHLTDKGIVPDYYVPTTKQDLEQSKDPQLTYIMQKLIH
jgi:hypothetical protein